MASWFDSVTAFASSVREKVERTIENERAHLNSEEAQLRAQAGIQELSRTAAPLPWHRPNTQGDVKGADSGTVNASADNNDDDGNVEDPVKREILSLCEKLDGKYAFLLLDEPPKEEGGSRFEYDHTLYLGAARAAEQADPLLKDCRFLLVPAKLTDEAFWRRYFARVAQIRKKHGLPPLIESIRQYAREAAEKRVKEAEEERNRAEAVFSSGSSSTESAPAGPKLTLIQKIQGIMAPSPPNQSSSKSTDGNGAVNQPTESPSTAADSKAGTKDGNNNNKKNGGELQSTSDNSGSSRPETPDFAVKSGIDELSHAALSPVSSVTSEQVDQEFAALVLQTPPPSSKSDSDKSHGLQSNDTTPIPTPFTPVTDTDLDDEDWESELEKELSSLKS